MKLQKCFDKFFDPAFMKGCVDKVHAKQDPAKPETPCAVTDDRASLEAKVNDLASTACFVVASPQELFGQAGNLGEPDPNDSLAGPSWNAGVC